MLLKKGLIQAQAVIPYAHLRGFVAEGHHQIEDQYFTDQAGFKREFETDLDKFDNYELATLV
jgi:hypothetical protein